mmetsp:Transcript_9959/g.29294  ORF Transcript_9959/g.29294 Transcript_9959/m.29294 type:complete len:111 (+) Transcript_9959:188-520(+)
MSASVWAAVGLTVGVTAKAMRNSISCIPLQRKPWEYVISGGIAAYLFSKWPATELWLAENINMMRAEVGQPPLDFTKGASGAIAYTLLNESDSVTEVKGVGMNKYFGAKE